MGVDVRRVQVSVRKSVSLILLANRIYSRLIYDVLKHNSHELQTTLLRSDVGSTGPRRRTRSDYSVLSSAHSRNTKL